jgi:uncharacterized membrane protein YidH (DUF202 family)
MAVSRLNFIGENNHTDNTLANERTFLGYLRTSLALSIIGVMIAQLYRLQHSEDPDPNFGYYVLSKPLAAIFYCAALCVVLLGCLRFWRQQSAMAVGKTHAGGFELISIGAGLLLVSDAQSEEREQGI